MALPGLSLPGLSLPGLGAGTPSSSTPLFNAPATIKRQSLGEGAEYRFEVPFSRTVKIKLLTGNAELFGSELAPTRQYKFSGVKAAIFTYHGCELEIEGEPENDYVGEETEMVTVYNAHFALEEMREATTRTRDATGPRALVVGPDNSGKTSLIRTLTSYAVKTDRQPTVVNLNPEEGILSMPGSLTATTFGDLLDVEEVGGWGSSPVSGPSAVPVKMPLVYFFGCRTPDANKSIYKALVTRLALAVTGRMVEDEAVRQAGIFIDSPGSISVGKSGSYEHIQHIASEFSVNVIAVIGSERLYQDMRRIFGTVPDGEDAVTIVRLPKSQGCVDQDAAFSSKYSQAQIRNYFFGPLAAPLSPYTQMVDFSQVSIYRVVDSTKGTSAFDPGADDDGGYDHTSSGGPAMYRKVVPSMQLQSSILAITRAGADDSQDRIRDSSVLGFIYVAEVDEAKLRMRVLSPISGRVPSNALIVGDWPEAVMDMIS